MQIKKEQIKDKKETLIRLNDRIQEQTRLSFETQEAIKREKLIQAAKMKSEQEKVQNQQQAQTIADKALDAYKKQDYKSAVKLFEKAAQLDPDNDVFYYQYAVCLYKTKNYNKSLSILSMVEGGEQNPTEHQYYVALNLLKLNEIDKAVSEFREIKEDDDKKLSPIAAFYAGNIELKQNKFKEV